MIDENKGFDKDGNMSLPINPVDMLAGMILGKSKDRRYDEMKMALELIAESEGAAGRIAKKCMESISKTEKSDARTTEEMKSLKNQVTERRNEKNNGSQPPTMDNLGLAECSNCNRKFEYNGNTRCGYCVVT